MKLDRKAAARSESLSRRGFLAAGGAAVAGGALAISPVGAFGQTEEKQEEPQRIRKFRTLGRTGFEVSDIGLGCVRISEANVVRYAYDRGVNYFDTAESYSNGESERKIGEAMSEIDRGKVFITTKLTLDDEHTEKTIVERLGQSLERLKTDHVDALFMHSIKSVRMIDHSGFHAATARLKADGKIRFVGISSHGPDDETQDSMEKVLTAAAEDGRFDLMLLVYNFMNTEASEKILAACKKKNVGTTAMKTAPGYLEVEPWDPENPSEDYTAYIERMEQRGQSREESIRKIIAWVEEQQKSRKEMEPFIEKYGIKTQEQLRQKAVQWALQNPDMHTLCVLMQDFDLIDRFIPLSGTKLSSAEELFLKEYNHAYNNHYCRHGCSACLSACPEGVPVGKIMRYSYYFAHQGREKFAMGRYARLHGPTASRCTSCDAPCAGACPYGLAIQANLIRAHALLTLA